MPKWVPIVAGVVVIALIVAFAVVASGFSKWAPRPASDNIWVMQKTGSSGSFAQINTDSSELATPVESEDKYYTSIAQWGNAAVGLDKDKNLVSLNQADPKTPGAKIGTADNILTADQYMLASAAQGQSLLVGKIGSTGLTAVPALPKSAPVVASTIDDEGTVTMLSKAGGVYRSSATGSSWGEPQEIGKLTGFATDGASLSTFGQNWAALASDGTKLVVNGNDAQSVTAGAVLAQASANAGELVVASASNALVFGADGKHLKGTGSTYKPSGSLVATAPVWRDGAAYIGWLPQQASGDNADDAQFATYANNKFAVSRKVNATIPYAPSQVQPDPEFSTNGANFVLNDTGTGRTWQLSGDTWKLVPSSVKWDIRDNQTQQQSKSDPIDAKKQYCPKPASGKDAEFGVRKGQSALLPVLLHATDRNSADSISIVQSGDSPKTSDGIDVRVVDNGQKLAVDAPANAKPFEIKYKITDGAANCNVPATAVVTPQDQQTQTNKAPVFVPNTSNSDGTISAGKDSSVEIDALERWLDPDGDQMYIDPTSVSTSTKGNSAAAGITDDGKIVVKLNDFGAGKLEVKYKVSDGLVSSAHTQVVNVASDAQLHTQPVTLVTGNSARSQTLSLGDAFIGGYDCISIADLKPDQQGMPKLTASATGVSVTVAGASKPGNYGYTYTAKRKGSADKTKNTLRLVVTGGTQKISLAPVTIFTQDGQDSLIDGLSTAVSSTDKPLWVSSVDNSSIRGMNGGSFDARVVDGDKIKVTGNGNTGKIGEFRFTVSDGSAQASTTATVVLVSQPTSDPLAVNDHVTMQQGAQLNLDVTANDVAPLGAQIRLDPRTRTDTTRDEFVRTGGLAFPTASSLRLLAPHKPGTYQVFYDIYVVGSPALVGHGALEVRVVAPAAGSITAPTLTGTISDGSTTTVSLPNAQLDSAGSVVSITSVEQPTKGSAEITPDGRGVKVTGTVAGQDDVEIEYTLSSSQGGNSATGMVILGSTVAEQNPVTYTDFVYASANQTVKIDPTLNDTTADSNGKLALVTTKPDSVESKYSDGQQYAIANPDPTSDANHKNVVTVQLRNNSETRYIYTVQSAPYVTATGIIVVKPAQHDKDAIKQYPVVADSTVGPDQLNKNQTAFTMDMAKSVAYTGRLDMTIPKGIGDNNSAKATQVGSAQTVTGELRKTTSTVVVKWQDATDDSVVTYGLLSVPAKSELLPELKQPVTALHVDEGSAVTKPLSDYLSASSRNVQVSDVHASGQNKSASCIANDTDITYKAAKPSQAATDSCTFRAKFAGASRWATLTIPVQIKLATIPPKFTGADLGIVMPGGEPKTDNLQNKIQKTPGVNAIKFAANSVESNDVKMTVSPDGVVRVIAQKIALQGFIAKLTTRITGWNGQDYPGQPVQTISVRVGSDGIAQLALRQVTKTCNVGASCSIDLGSENAGVRKTGNLKLTDVWRSGGGPNPTRANGSNTVSFEVSKADPGKDYQYNYSMEDDARKGGKSNSGTGAIILTVQAPPDKPTIENTSNTKDSVTVEVSASGATPAIDGFKIGNQECAGFMRSPNGGGTAQCTVSGLDPTDADKIYEITAYNQVGDSDAVSTKPIGAFNEAEPVTNVNWSVAADSRSVTVTFEVPKGQAWKADDGGWTQSAAGKLTRTVRDDGTTINIATRSAKQNSSGGDYSYSNQSVDVYGAPAPQIHVTNDGDSNNPNVTVKVTNSVSGVDYEYAFAAKGSNSCSGWQSGNSRTYSGLPSNETTTLTACARISGGVHVTGTGKTISGTTSVTTIEIPDGLRVQYSVNDGSQSGDYFASWDNASGNSAIVESDGRKFRIELPGIRHQYGTDINGSTQMQVTALDPSGSTVGDPQTKRVSVSSKDGPYPVKVDASNLRCTTPEDDGAAPAADPESVNVRDADSSDYSVTNDGMKVVINFEGNLSGLKQFRSEDCNPDD